MDKTLQDLAWSCLPKEFKEEVKRMYRIADSDVDQMIATIMLENVFGLHNLTSDAEGEDEMLCVSRKQIDALQGEIFKAIVDAHDADDWQDAAHYILDVMPRSFAALFGSKCLPDEEAIAGNVTITQKPDEPTINIETVNVPMLHYAFLQLEKAAKIVRESLNKNI